MRREAYLQEFGWFDPKMIWLAPSDARQVVVPDRSVKLADPSSQWPKSEDQQNELAT